MHTRIQHKTAIFLPTRLLCSYIFIRQSLKIRLDKSKTKSNQGSHYSVMWWSTHLSKIRRFLRYERLNIRRSTILATPRPYFFCAHMPVRKYSKRDLNILVCLDNSFFNQFSWYIVLAKCNLKLFDWWYNILTVSISLRCLK